jgi:hypothetical protein
MIVRHSAHTTNAAAVIAATLDREFEQVGANDMPAGRLGEIN